MRLVFALVAGLALAPPPALAQPAADSTPSTTAPALSLTDAAARVEEVWSSLVRVESKAKPTADVAAIDQELGEQTAAISARRERDEAYLAGEADLSQLRAIYLRWSDDDALLAEWDKKLSVRAQELALLVADVDALNALWQRTREQLRSAAPAELEGRIDAALEKIGAVRGAVVARRDEVLTVRNHVARQRALVARMQNAVDGRRKELLGSLQQRDAPLWEAWKQPSPGSVASRVRQAFGRESEDLVEFLTSRRTQAPYALASLLSLIAVAVSVARRVRSRQDRLPERDRLTLVVERPMSAALVLWVLLLPWLHVPVVVRRLATLVLVVPLARLLGPLLGPKAPAVTAFIVVPVILDRLEEVLAGVPEIARPIFLLEMAVALVAVHWARRQRWDARPGAPADVWIVRLTWWAETIVLAAMAAHVLGYRRLAGVLSDGTVLSAVAGLGLWVTKRVLDGVVTLLLDGWPLDQLQVVQRSRNQLERRARRIVGRILQVLWVLLVLEVFHVRGIVLDALASLLTRPLQLGELGFTLGDLVLLAVSIWASFVLARMIRAILEDEVLSRVHLARGVPYAISTFTSYAVLLLGIFVALVAAGIDVSRLTIVVGALGVGIGLGLQEIVKDLVAGAVLLFERPIQLGDVVQVGELTGDVRRIGLRSSTVRTYEGAEVIVPNSSLTANRIVNWTLSDRARRVDLPVGVAYGTDPAQVIALLEGLARRNPDVMDDPEPRALFMGFGESSLDFQLRTWIHRVEEVASFRSELAISVNAALVAAGISVPFPQRDVHLVGVAADAIGRAPGS